jgi:hypothetical protein
MPLRYHVLTLSLIGASCASASAIAADAKLQGVYSNMEPSVEQGQLIGIEVFILPHVEEEKIAYSALVQFANGVPARPQLVDLDVEGQSVGFSVTHPDAGEIRFEGSIDADGLGGRFDTLGEIALPRGESIWQWGASGR